MFLIQHTKYPQRDFIAYAHLYIIGYLSKIVEWKSQFVCHYVEWKRQNTTKPAMPRVLDYLFM